MESMFGMFLIGIFIVGYYFIAMEERYRTNKAEVAMLMGTMMFLLIGLYGAITGYRMDELESTIERVLSEVLSLAFFLWIVMIYVEFLEERNLFRILHQWIISKEMTYRQIFWLLGVLTFFLSAIIDNLTTSLVMSTIILTINRTNKKILIPLAVNTVVASNAGGAWSAFGDVTSLMVWTAGKIEFLDFVWILPACLVGWIVTALFIYRKLPKDKIKVEKEVERVVLKPGGKIGIFFALLTIFFAVMGHSIFHLPSVWGMMTGFSIFLVYGAIKKDSHVFFDDSHAYRFVKNIDFQTLFFFIGILSAVDALYFMGQLNFILDLYDNNSPNIVSVFVGVLSAIVDNVPIMQMILSVSPEMTESDWLLLTLTAGTGGSLLIFGSAAGVAIMGKMKGLYTFKDHFRYTPIIFIGYMVSVLTWIFQVSL